MSKNSAFARIERAITDRKMTPGGDGNVISVYSVNAGVGASVEVSANSVAVRLDGDLSLSLLPSQADELRNALNRAAEASPVDGSDRLSITAIGAKSRIWRGLDGLIHITRNGGGGEIAFTDSEFRDLASVVGMVAEEARWVSPGD